LPLHGFFSGKDKPIMNGTMELYGDLFAEQRGQQARTEPVTTILPPVDIFEDEAGLP
jgi:hypothetical protein